MTILTSSGAATTSTRRPPSESNEMTRPDRSWPATSALEDLVWQADAILPASQPTPTLLQGAILGPPATSTESGVAIARSARDGAHATCVTGVPDAATACAACPRS